MKVRDCSSVVPLGRTKLLVIRFRTLVEPDGSRIAIQRFHDMPDVLTSFDREFDLPDSYVRYHPIR